MSSRQKVSRYENNFKKTLEQAQEELNTVERHFSKLTHSSFVEMLSSVFENSIARPIPMLTGAVIAFIGVLALYIIANEYGLALSGSETILIFAVGWLLGLIIDILVKRVFRK